MALDPLSLLILLFFLAVVALALTLWFLLTLGQRLRPPPPKKVTAPRAARIAPADPKNDDFRGATAKVKPAVPALERPVAGRPTHEHSTHERSPPERPNSKQGDDAFERFIKSKNDELEF